MLSSISCIPNLCQFTYFCIILIHYLFWKQITLPSCFEMFVFGLIISFVLFFFQYGSAVILIINYLWCLLWYSIQNLDVFSCIYLYVYMMYFPCVCSCLLGLGVKLGILVTYCVYSQLCAIEYKIMCLCIHLFYTYSDTVELDLTIFVQSVII